jgi:hypothetical protein
MEYIKNTLFDKVIFFIDFENKLIKRNKYFHNFFIKLFCHFYKKFYLYKRDGIYHINSKDNLKINPLIKNFELINNNKITNGNYLLDIYRNNIPFWIILENENINVDKIKIKYFDNSEKQIDCLNMKDNLFYNIIKK